MNNPEIQASFNQYRKITKSLFIINQHYYELPAKTIEANSIFIWFSNQTISETFKLSYQDKTSTDMAPNDFKIITFI